MTERRVRNLTAMFYAAPHLPVHYKGDTFTAELIDRTPDKPFELGVIDRDVFYIVVAGWGALNDTELTAGDVLYVPAGVARDFIGLSQHFSAWKLTLE